MNKIAALESLRGVLALWVVVGHVVSLAYGITELSSVHLGFLYQPILAVYVFIILSGFVIMYLLDKGTLTYGPFLLRRFLRIFPLYLAVLAVSALTLSSQLDAEQSLPWRHAGIVSDIAIHIEAVKNFWVHMATHLVLLQGIVPPSLLSYPEYTFIGQAWSISLEWQFYLMAPLLAFLIARRRWHVLGGLAVAFLLLHHFYYGSVGFIGNQSGFFAVGIISFYLFKYLRGRPMSGPFSDFIVLTAALIVYFFSDMSLPLMAWTVAMMVILFPQAGAQGLVTGAAKAVLENRFIRWIGEISYSIYLVHRLVMYAVLALIMRLYPAIPKAQFLMISLPATLILTVAVSAVTFNLIEAPCMKWSRRRSDESSALADVSLKVTP